MLEALRAAGYAVDPALDAPILELLRTSAAFDAEELIGVIEDMYAEPTKKRMLLAVLEDGDRREAALGVARPAASSPAWVAALAHFRARAG